MSVCNASPCRATEQDGMIRMFTGMTVLIVFFYIWRIAGPQCSNIQGNKKMTINFIILTMLFFTIITIWFSGVVPVEAYKETLKTNEFADCGSDGGYQLNGLPFVTKGKNHYLKANFTSDNENGLQKSGEGNVKGDSLSDEWRHLYHLVASATAGALIAGIYHFAKGASGGSS